MGASSSTTDTCERQSAPRARNDPAVSETPAAPHQQQTDKIGSAPRRASHHPHQKYATPTIEQLPPAPAVFPTEAPTVESNFRADPLPSPESSVPALAAGRLSRHGRVCLLLGGVWLLNGFDLAFTIVAYAHGSFTELNPLAASLLGGPWYLIALYKFVLLVSGTIILWKVARHSVAELASWFLLATYTYVAVRWYVYFYCMTADVTSLAQIGPL